MGKSLQNKDVNAKLQQNLLLENQLLREGNETIKEQNEIIKQENDSLKQEMEICKQQNEKLTESVSELKATLEAKDCKSEGMKKISKELAKQRKEKSNLQDKLRKSESDIKGLKKVQADLISSLYLLQKQIDDKDTGIKEVKEREGNEESDTVKIKENADQAKQLVSKTTKDRKTKTRK